MNNTDAIVRVLRERIEILSASSAGLRPYFLFVPPEDLAALKCTEHHNRTTGMTFLDGVRLVPYGRNSEK